MSQDARSSHRTARTVPARAAHHDPRRLDVTALARSQAALQGEWPVDGFERLREEGTSQAAPDQGAQSQDASQLVRWRAQGFVHQGLGVVDQPGLHLLVDAKVPRTCQRCLQPLTLNIHVDRRFVFAATEAQAAKLDALTDDDVLVNDRTLDLHELVEDELLLALPVVALHDTCPQPVSPWLAAAAQAAHPEGAGSTATTGPEDTKHTPFAVLAALRKSSPSKP